MKLSLVMFKADGQKREFHLSKPISVIGRKTSCDLRIPLSSVSRQHCQVEMRGSKAFLRDLGSSNGTFYNNRRVQETQLEPGDRIKIGPVYFTVRIDGTPDDEDIQPMRTVLSESAMGMQAIGFDEGGSGFDPFARPIDEVEEDEVDDVIEDAELYSDSHDSGEAVAESIGGSEDIDPAEAVYEDEDEGDDLDAYVSAWGEDSEDEDVEPEFGDNDEVDFEEDPVEEEIVDAIDDENDADDLAFAMASINDDDQDADIVVEDEDIVSDEGDEEGVEVDEIDLDGMVEEEDIDPSEGSAGIEVEEVEFDAYDEAGDDDVEGIEVEEVAIEEPVDVLDEEEFTKDVDDDSATFGFGLKDGDPSVSEQLNTVEPITGEVIEPNDDEFDAFDEVVETDKADEVETMPVEGPEDIIEDDDDDVEGIDAELDEMDIPSPSALASSGDEEEEIDLEEFSKQDGLEPVGDFDAAPEDDEEVEYEYEYVEVDDDEALPEDEDIEYEYEEVVVEDEAEGDEDFEEYEEVEEEEIAEYEENSGDPIDAMIEMEIEQAGEESADDDDWEFIGEDGEPDDVVDFDFDDDDEDRR